MGIWASERVTRGAVARVGVGIGVAVGRTTGLAVATGWVARTDVGRECEPAWPPAVGELAPASQGRRTAIRAAPRTVAEASIKRLPGRSIMPTPYAPRLAGR